MRRSWRVLAVAFFLVAGVVFSLGSTALGASGGSGRGGLAAGGGGYFAIGCGFSHRNNDDPIVFPGQPGRSHNHTYFGNRTTNAGSTPATLRGEATTCSLRADTAAYWVPTLFVGGRAVEPRGATVYYIRRTFERVQAFPPGLQMIAGDAAATRAQGVGITLWSCGGGRGRASTTVPDCEAGFRRSGLRLQVNYPNCWNGRSLDSANHRSHMAYSVRGVCPESHPVALPALTIVVRYGIAVERGANVSLSSGGQLSGHADFVNAWDQRTLERLVDRYLNRGR